MVHDGAGKYYAPNECAGITVIPIVVQLGSLQCLLSARQSTDDEQAVANAYQSFFEFVSTCRTVVVRPNRTKPYPLHVGKTSSGHKRMYAVLVSHEGIQPLILTVDSVACYVVS